MGVAVGVGVGFGVGSGVGGGGVGVGFGVGFGDGVTRGPPEGRGVPVGECVAPPGCDVWRGVPGGFVGFGRDDGDGRARGDGLLVVLDLDPALLDDRHVARVQLRAGDEGVAAFADRDRGAVGQRDAHGVVEDGPVAERDLDVDLLRELRGGYWRGTRPAQREQRDERDDARGRAGQHDAATAPGRASGAARPLPCWRRRRIAHHSPDMRASRAEAKQLLKEAGAEGLS